MNTLHVLTAILMGQVTIVNPVLAESISTITGLTIVTWKVLGGRWKRRSRRPAKSRSETGRAGWLCRFRSNGWCTDFYASRHRTHSCSVGCLLVRQGIYPRTEEARPVEKVVPSPPSAASLFQHPDSRPYDCTQRKSVWFSWRLNNIMVTHTSNIAPDGHYWSSIRHKCRTFPWYDNHIYHFEN